MYLNNLTEASVGQKIEFVYNAGSAPGIKRTVRVLETHPRGSTLDMGWIRGEDLNDENCPKNFSAHYADDVMVVDEQVESTPTGNAIVNRIPFTDVRKAIASKIEALSSDQLVELYSKFVVDNHDIDVEFDEQTGDVVVSEPEIDPFFSFDPNQNMMIVNKQKEGMVIVQNEDCTVDILYTDNLGLNCEHTETNVCPDDLINNLCDFMI